MTETTPCVLTDWRRDRDGYGYRRAPDGRHWFAHRWAWAQARGPIPAGMKVLHRCDNRPCVRVGPLRPDGTPDPDDHLFLGTVADNNADMVAKGRNRAASGDAHGAHTKPGAWPRGDDHWTRRDPEKMLATRARGDRSGPRAKPESYVGLQAGERNPASRLTREQVVEVRERLGAGESQMSIARAFGVSQGAISHIKWGNTWAEE